ncbi:UNVERIFIED_ORG: DNA-binding SARP family transcriptional activator [Arthrobacter sp. UYEF13]
MGNDGYGELKLDLLRPWQLRRDAVTLHIAARQQRLIAALAVRGPSLRSYIVGLLWPEYPDARALESLRVSVHLVSHQVPGLIVNAGAMLSLHDRVDVDLYRFRAQILALREDRHLGDAASLLHEWRDADLLPGWYEDWVVFEQGRLLQDRLRTLTAMSQKLLALGDFQTAVEAAEAAVVIEPLYESGVRVLIAAELQGGNPGAALRAYERYRRQLQKDMGLLPPESVRHLVAHALEHQTRVAKDRLVLATDSWLNGEPALNHS